MPIEILPDWLKQKVSFEEVEASHMLEIRGQLVPFGYVGGSWKDLLSKRQPGDELWSYSSDAESWENLAGRAGYALVREGAVIAKVETVMN